MTRAGFLIARRRYPAHFSVTAQRSKGCPINIVNEYGDHQQRERERQRARQRLVSDLRIAYSSLPARRGELLVSAKQATVSQSLSMRTIRVVHAMSGQL